MKNEWLLYLLILAILTARIVLYFTEPKPYKNGDLIRITSVVRSEPIRYDSSQYLKIEGLKVYLPLLPEIGYGDRIVIEGKVNSDTLKNPKLISLERARGILYKFRNRLLNFYESSLPSPYSSLVAGVTIGSKSEISQEFWNELKNSGTAHVVVASGMNISLVGGFLLGLFVVFFKRKKALILALIGIWLYAVISGFDAPIVRSAIMGTIAFSAQEVGRLNTSVRALIISGVIMLIANPGYLIDAGFLLSFFATLGLILFQGKIGKWMKKVPLYIREDLSTTLAAQIGVVPLLFYFFGRFNLLSPLINVLVLWTVVPITMFGMIGGFVGLAVPILGKGILFLSYPFMWWFVKVVQLFGN